MEAKISLQLTSLLGRDEGGSRSDESEEGEKAHHFECSIMYWICKQRVMRIGRGEPLIRFRKATIDDEAKAIASSRANAVSLFKDESPGSFRRG